MPIVPMVWILAAPFVLFALGTAPQEGAPAPGGPTAIEEALIEHACNATQPASTPTSEAYQSCLSARLASLRADFGRDLSRLSGAERRALDAACNKSRAAEGQDAYLACLDAQLVSLRERRSRSSPVASAATPIAPPPGAPPESPAPPARAVFSSFSGVWIGVTVVAVLAAAGGVFLAVKARRAGYRCRVCGVGVAVSGELCPQCRHETADVLRRAAAERADRERAHAADEERRQREHEEAQRAQRAREGEEAEERLRREEEARQREEAARREPQDEERARAARQAPPADEEAELVFDPYDVLGVVRAAGRDAIEIAYQEGRLKYAPEQVAHLGDELQGYYRKKAAAVDRAYRMLTA
jgi:hypothetical protein